MFDTLSAWFTTALFTVGGQPYRLFDLFLVLAILIGGLWLAGSFRTFIIQRSNHYIDLGTSPRMLIANFGKYTIVVITFLIVLSTLGLNLTSLAVVAGALSVGIGFGLQNIVNNFVSGIILLIEKSIRIGDLIEVSDAVVGRVQEIRLRSTIITTFDNVELVVPNSELVQNRIVNRTLTSGVRRLRMPFGVAYGTDVEQVRSAILSAVAQSSLRCYSDEEKKPDVWMTGLGASSVDYALLVWIDAEQPDPPLPSDFYILIYNALNAAKIPIPFPQLDVHMTREQ